MKMMSALLERDIGAQASMSFQVLAIELDSGPVFLAGRSASLGDDVLHAAVLSIGQIDNGGFGVTIENQALPAYADGWWINRAAMLLDVTPDMESVYDGLVRFDGRIDAEPSEQNGVLSFAVAPYRKIIKTLPGLGLIEASAWPLASDAAMGAQKPMIFGTVEDCPLLAVQVQPGTTLTEAATPADAQLAVADATVLAASGSVVVDGHTYTYSSRTDTLLLGMVIVAGHRPGTLVAQAGSNVYLAAGEAVTAIDTLRASPVGAGSPAILEGGTIDLAAATVTYTAPPAVVAAAERYTRFEQFDALATGNTASNGVNAIRAVINTYTQSGTPTGTITNATENGGISFARPADGNRIVSGTYAVQFSVAVGSQVGWARIKIGGDVVWFYEPGAGVLYNNSPAAITFDDDADLLPVVVEVAAGGSTDQVTVTIVTASRLILTGNLDDANYATVAPGQALKVKQTGALADLGPIASVKLGVRWFKTDATIGTTAVTFAGRALGPLKVTQAGGASLNQTINVNVTSQGTASLPQQNISTVVSGGTASLSHSSIAQQQVVYAVTAPVGGTATERGFSKIPTLTGWESALGAITCKLAVRTTTGAAPTNAFMYANIRRANGTTIAQASINTIASWTNVATNLYEGSFTISELPDSVFWEETFKTASTDTMVSMAFSYNAKITNGSVSQNNTPAAGYSNPLTAQALGNSGIAVAASNNVVTLTVPAPPRMTDTLYDLPWIGTWAALTDTVAEIALTGTGASLAICQVWLQIEYDVQTFAAAEQITATVTGRSGNPADVIATLAEASGETVALADQVRLAAWCTANGMAFARRLSEPADALQLLTFAAEQAACDLYPSPAGLIMRRWDDEACPLTAVADADLLDVAAVAWSDRVETDITLSYRDDYATGNGMIRVVQANAANTMACAQTEAAILATGAVHIEGGWLRSDAAAALLLAAYVRRYAAMRRLTTLSLPYRFSAVAAGELIDWRDAFWRVTEAATDNGWTSLALEERPVS